MKKISLNLEDTGMYACYWPIDGSKFAFIVLCGDDREDFLARLCVKWLHKQNINCLTMSPNKKDYSHHSLELERFVRAIKYLKENGNKKIGIIGMSTTAMVSLVAASYFKDLSLTIALSPSDFVMEGFYQEKGIERPGNNESSLSYKNEDLPYLPYAYRHPEYYEKIQEESKRTGNKIASRELFNESERLNTVTEDMRIKVENIRGTILFIGAEDDSMWDTVKYIKRMKNVLLNAMKKGANARFLTYKHGTHFVLPESLLKMTHLPTSLLPSLFFKEGKLHKKECRETRIDIDNNIKDAIKVWQEITLISDCERNHIKHHD